jgi:hypothetical protein
MAIFFSRGVEPLEVCQYSSIEGGITGLRDDIRIPLRLNQWNSVGMVSVLSPYSRNVANVSSEMGIQTGEQCDLCGLLVCYFEQK